MEDQRAARVSRARWAIVAALALGAPAGCKTPYIGTTASSFLHKIEESSDPNIRYLAYSKLGSPNCYDDEQQKAKAASVLIAALEPGKEPMASRAVICRTLGVLRRPEARPALLRAIDDPAGAVRAEACVALGPIARPEDASVLARVMAADTQLECRIAAIEGLGHLKVADPRITVALVDNLEHRDPAVRFASLQALRSLSGKDLGVEPGPWKKYAQEVVARAEAKPGEMKRQ
jgi:HEAT repeat protein